jgi:ubiquitin-protein ligase
MAERILKEAQEIGSEFPFFMVDNQVNHLWGHCYESPDGTKYSIELQFPADYPASAPEVLISEEIDSLLQTLNLSALETWSENSKAIDIVREIRTLVQGALNPPAVVTPPRMVKAVGPKASPPREDIICAQCGEPAGAGKFCMNCGCPKGSPSPPNIDPDESEMLPSAPELGASDASPISAPSSGEGEYLTPDFDSYDGEINSYDSYVPEGEDVSGEAVPGESFTGTFEELDVAVIEQSGLLQQFYAMDYIDDSPGNVNIYLTITLEMSFTLGVDFRNYPKRPTLSIPDGIKRLTGDPTEMLKTMKKWNEQKPPNVVDVVQEIENTLYFIQDVSIESKYVMGEYQAESIDGVISHLKVTFITFGFKTYELTVDLHRYPEAPEIEYSPELAQLVTVPPASLPAMTKWRKQESHVVDVLREIAWYIDKSSRIAFELSMLKGMKEVKFDDSSNTITVVMEGRMKTADIMFEFTVKLPMNYPTGTPAISLKNELEGQEDIKEKLTKMIKEFQENWNTYSYLVDVFDKISKAVFEVSVATCILCHKIDCPTCAKKIADSNPEDQCYEECPHCKRPYHKHCWDMTMQSFGKCGVCMRAPNASS